MIGAEQAIASGYAAFQRKDYDTARKHLRGVRHPQAMHLLGLVEKAAGNYEVAKTTLEEAGRLDPRNHEIWNNQGLLARLMGDLQTARAKFERALALKPDFRSAQLSLGRTLSGLGLYEQAIARFAPLVNRNGRDLDARIGYANAALDLNDSETAKAQIEAALALDPSHASARFAKGVLAFNIGRLAEAEAIFTTLLSEGISVAEANHMMARVKLFASDVAAARTYAEASFRQAPASKNFQTLADIYWMSGDTQAFDTLVNAAISQPGLMLEAIAFRRKAGHEAEALALLDAQSAPSGQSAPVQSLRSALLLDLGDIDGAIAAGRLARSGVETPDSSLNLVRALLAAGQTQEALDLIHQARALDPLSQFWLGYEATALRLLDDPQYGKLIEYDRHVQASQLPVPEGFETLEAFNAAFLDLLDEMNPFEVHPLNQSLRGGGQAPHDLTKSRHPVLQAYFKALDQPISEYMRILGTSPNHPSSARNTGHYEFSGGWSVRLSGGGHHVNHLHPRGWISSAYYVSVPPASATPGDKAGWLKFGEPPIATDPVLAPEKWIQPKAGMVVLFPSFLWHGTEPIHDGAVRVTAPFDVVPVKAS